MASSGWERRRRRCVGVVDADGDDMGKSAKCPVAAKYNYNGCGQPARPPASPPGKPAGAGHGAEGGGREEGLSCGRQLRWHVKRNEMTREHGTGGTGRAERGRGGRDHAPLDIVGQPQRKTARAAAV